MAKRPTRKRAKQGGARVTSSYRKAQVFAPHTFQTRVALVNDVPMVYLTRKVYSELFHIIDLSDDEVGFLGTVTKTTYGNFLIDEVFILKQEVTAGSTELSEEGIADLTQELLQREDGVDTVNSIRFWGHSHVRMGTSPSGQDDHQMELFEKNGCPWFIRGILNKLGRMEFTIFFFDSGVKIVDAPWAIYEFVNDEERDRIEEELAQKVTKGRSAVVRYARHDESDDFQGFGGAFPGASVTRIGGSS